MRHDAACCERRLEHPVAERHDLAGPFRDRDELAGRDVAVFGVMPPDERLCTGHLTGSADRRRACTRVGVVAPPAPRPVRCGTRGACVATRRIAGSKIRIWPFPGPLRLVHRDVGVAQQARCVHLRRCNGHPDARQHRNVVPSDRDRSRRESSNDSATSIARSIPPRSSSRMANSSPPSRAAVSPLPAACRIRSAAVFEQLVADGVAERHR